MIWLIYTFTELTQCKTEKKLLEQKVEGFTQREVSLQRELELVQITLKQKEERELATNTRYRKIPKNLIGKFEQDGLPIECKQCRRNGKQCRLILILKEQGSLIWSGKSVD